MAIQDSHTVHGRFFKIAQMHPDAPAIASAAGELSYDALAARACSIAEALRQQDVMVGNVVGIALPRGVDRIATILATLIVGGAYVPLDDTHPRKRIEGVCSDAGVKLVVTYSGAGISSFPCPTIDIESCQGSEGSLERDAVGAAGDLAYVMYTSGSTGKPKGVAIEHRGVLALCNAWDDLMSEHDVRQVLQFSSYTFDASVVEIFPTLLTGRTLRVLDEDPGQISPTALLASARQAGDDMVILPPVYLMAADADMPALPKVLMVAGERCPPALVQRWADRTALYNGYGPTEATVAATVGRCSRSDSAEVPIGPPLPHITTAVRNDEQTVATGEIGELYLGGESLARGYVSNPIETEARFRFIELEDGRRERMYATGDLVRMRPDGQFVFMGRADRQVKVRGHRIELDAVEATIQAVPGVTEAAVVDVTDERGETRLVAFVRDLDDAIVKGLRGDLEEMIPAAQIPAQITSLTNWPTRSSGKVDYDALRRLAIVPTAPANGQADDAVGGVWQTLLEVPVVADSDDFFALGGHSILAMHLAEAIREQFDIEISARDVFEHSTLGEFRQVVEDLRSEATTASRVDTH